MVKLIRQGVYYMDGKIVKETQAFMTSDKKEAALKNTISYPILAAHSAGFGETLALKPDAVTLYDGKDVFRTVDFCGLKEFPLPVYLFGGAYDGTFMVSAAKKWGGVYVPDNLACTGAYVCEQIAESGQLLFHNGGVSCGALGAMSVWTDEGDILRTLMKERTELARPEILAVYLKGKLRKGVGPTDVALALMQAFENAGNFANEKVLEFFGAGVGNLSMDYRNAIDSALDCGCVSTVWMTDGRTKEYFETHLRGGAFKVLAPIQPAYYDGAAVMDLSDIEPMIGVEGTIMTVKEFMEAPLEPYMKDGRAFLHGTSVEYECASYETMAEAAEILQGKKIGGETAFSWLPYSKSVTLALVENGYLGTLLRAGADFNDLLLDPCGGAGQDANFGSDSFARLDARTIAATLANGGYLTSALGLDYNKRVKKYKFDPAPYESRVLDLIGKRENISLAYDEEIGPLPVFPPLPDCAHLSVDGEEGMLAVTLGDPDAYFWKDAIYDRERGVLAVLAKEFPEKLRTHLLDWGILPLVYQKFDFKEGDVLHLENLAELVKSGEEKFVCKVERKRRSKDVALTLGALTDAERKILLAGGKNNLVRGK